ncbi:MAG: ATP-binding protein [Synechococcales bacterium]|nr:ATP-binding protein [Synechococcales bacterium]
MFRLANPRPSKQVQSSLDTISLDVDSALEVLTLHDARLETTDSGKAAALLFTESPLLPGILLMRHTALVGMLSRQRFLEHMSKPYSLELFLERPLEVLYEFIGYEPLRLPQSTPIVEAARRSLERPTHQLYEPLVVELSPNTFRLLDIHQLLVAQSHIHELTARLLDEKTQAFLVQTEKMASLGRTIAGVSHEIKNPVTCIQGNLQFISTYSQNLIQLLAAYQEALPEKPDTIQQIEHQIDLPFLLEDLPSLQSSLNLATNRLVEIVSSLRNFSRLDKESKQLADIPKCIEGTLLILANQIKQGIEVVRDYDANAPQLWCYPGQLSQVFMNIIANAIDALEEKQSQMQKNSDWRPRLVVKTRVVPSSDRPTFIIQIADNGNGIPEEHLNKVFEAFFTTKIVGKGTGLGLAISHQVVTQRHGGQLKVRSRPNEGTEFEISLPIEATAD